MEHLPLGINPVILLAQIVNFAILFFILKKFIFDKVIELVKDQRKKEKQTKIRVEKIEEKYQNIEKEKQKIIAKTEIQAEAIITDAKKKAEVQKQEITKLAKLEADKIRKDSLLEMNQKQEEMKKEVQNYASNLAVSLASKLISQYLNQDQQRQLIQKSIARIKKLKLK
jgi:F-type H+-transporting ATPase subunit b